MWDVCELSFNAGEVVRVEEQKKPSQNYEGFR